MQMVILLCFLLASTSASDILGHQYQHQPQHQHQLQHQHQHQHQLQLQLSPPPPHIFSRAPPPETGPSHDRCGWAPMGKAITNAANVNAILTSHNRRLARRRANPYRPRCPADENCIHRLETQAAYLARLVVYLPARRAAVTLLQPDQLVRCLQCRDLVESMISDALGWLEGRPGATPSLTARAFALTEQFQQMYVTSREG